MGVVIDVQVEPGPQGVGKCWVDVVVETSSGALFHGGSEPADMPGFGKRERERKAGFSSVFGDAAMEAAKKVQAQLATGSAVDAHLLDQLILPATLADGTSKLLTAEPSLHATTAIHIAKLFIPRLVVSQRKVGALTLIEITGIGHGSEASQGAGQPSGAASAAATASAALKPDEEAMEVAKGALSKATKSQLEDIVDHLDLTDNKGKLTVQISGADVTADFRGDRFVLRGETCEIRQAAREEIGQVLDFYFPQSSWKPK